MRSITTLLVTAFVLTACASAGSGDPSSPEEPPNVSQDATESTSVPDQPAPPARSDARSEAESTGTTVDAATDTTESPDNGSQSENRDEREDVRDDADTSPGEAVPTTVPSPPVTGEVPQTYLDAVLTDAADRTGVSVSDLEVLRSESVQWSDGSLGCPEPGVVYTQAVSSGYWVEIGAGEQNLDYRLNESGLFKLCSGIQTPHSSGSGSGTDPGDS